MLDNRADRAAWRVAWQVARLRRVTINGVAVLGEPAAELDHVAAACLVDREHAAYRERRAAQGCGFDLFPALPPRFALLTLRAAEQRVRGAR